MVGKTTTRRITPIIDFGEELLEHPQSSTFTANTDPDSQMSDSLSLSATDHDLANEFTEIDNLIRRYIDTCQFKLAILWADKRLALCRKGGRPPSFFDMAKYVKILSNATDWTRVIAFCERNDLFMKHLVFAYYYINALFKRKLYFEILKLKLGNLEGFRDPVNVTTPYMAHLYKVKGFLPSQEEIDMLNKIAADSNLEACILILIGKTYLMTQNRHNAQLYLRSAFTKEPTAIEALDIIKKYNLIPKRQIDELIEKSIANSRVQNILRHNHILIRHCEKPTFKMDANSDPLLADLSIRTTWATNLYNRGDIIGANKITTEILEETGFFQDCILVHIATLVQLHKCDQLFMLAHQLVDSEPDSEISWYTVGCYYYAANQPRAAKSFLNKCTIMNPLFGEGWIAFGHVLTAESEHEQAMNCYLRASRVLEGSFEPLMYIGLEYSYANNIKLAQDFLKDAADVAGDSALVLHEQGCIYYMKKDWINANASFSKALRLAYNETNENISLVDLISRPLSDFWEPLINNLGHVKRKLGYFSEAVKFHQKSLLMCPRRSGALSALAFSLACEGELELAIQYFHEALVVNPENQFMKECIEKILDWMEENTPLKNYGEFLPATRNEPMAPIQESDFELTEQEKNAQILALETLRRKTRRRLNRSDLRHNLSEQMQMHSSAMDISMDTSTP